MQRIGLLLGLAMLAGCNDSSRSRVRLTVTNEGAENVRIEVDVDHAWSSTDEHDRFLAPASSTSYTLHDVSRLMVRVFRESDNFKIFDDFWDARDLDHLDDRVTVIVTP